MALQSAIVLNHVAETRFRVFSQAHGLHDITYCSRAPARLMRGVIIEYTGVWHGRWYVAQNAGMWNAPAQWACSDIWFLHHVIEVLLACLCYAQPEPDVFALLHHLYRPVGYNIERAHAMFLARLFFLLGVQPENVLHLEPLMQYVAQHTFDELLTDTYYAYDEICEWLRCCSYVCDIYQPLQTHAFYTMRGS